ncbi:MAG TPA: hypothetical protein PLC47_00260, partial [Bacteroidales bacterium]|nr:hypothetical protein [Bacteroidales bacterium]
DWIVMGKGPITVSAVSATPIEQSLFDIDEQQTVDPGKKVEIRHEGTKETVNQLYTNKKSSPEFEEDLNNKVQKEIVRIILVYSDNTFEQLNPLQKH